MTTIHTTEKQSSLREQIEQVHPGEYIFYGEERNWFDHSCYVSPYPACQAGKCLRHEPSELDDAMGWTLRKHETEYVSLFNFQSQDVWTVEKECRSWECTCIKRTVRDYLRHMDNEFVRAGTVYFTAIKITKGDTVSKIRKRISAHINREGGKLLTVYTHSGYVYVFATVPPHGSRPRKVPTSHTALDAETAYLILHQIAVVGDLPAYSFITNQGWNLPSRSNKAKCYCELVEGKHQESDCRKRRDCSCDALPVAHKESDCYLFLMLGSFRNHKFSTEFRQMFEDEWRERGNPTPTEPEVRQVARMVKQEMFT